MNHAKEAVLEKALMTINHGLAAAASMFLCVVLKKSPLENSVDHTSLGYVTACYDSSMTCEKNPRTDFSVPFYA
jgi:hypothetical protein